MLNVKKLLTKVLVLCKGAIVTRDVSASATVNGNTNALFYFSVPSISGYTYIGIIGVKNSHGANFPITDFSAGSHTAVVRNLTSTQTTVTLTARLLFVKNELWGGSA